MTKSLVRHRRGVARSLTQGGVADDRAASHCAIPAAPLKPEPARWTPESLTAAWLGHATTLINLHGTMILTDPALRNRIGVGVGPATVGPRRLVQPALTARELPKIDLLVLSHAHMDHLDLGTLRQLPSSTPVVTHHELRDLLGHFDQVTELGWGERTRVAGVEIEAIPARHWGARTITDTYRGYGGFLLSRANRRVLFAGDTAYTDLYRQFRDRQIDLALLPIGAYDPWIDNHASPEEAWAMAEEMGARHILPIHHATFRLSREPVDEPINRLLATVGAENSRVALTRIGETWSAP